MKILYLIDKLARGGKERRLLELLKYISPYDVIEVNLAVMSEDIRYPEVYGLVPDVHFLIRRTKRDPGIFLKLLRLCRNIRPDIIHTWDPMTSIYAGPVAKLCRIKMINGMITNSSFKKGALRKGWVRVKIAFMLSDMIVANSAAGLRAYDAPAKKSVCIYNGFDFKRTEKLANPADVRKRFNIETPKIVGMVAGFTNKKDYAGYLSAAQSVLKRRRDVTFLAIGSGEELEKCISMVEKQNTDRIKFLGLQENVESIINIMDIGILTTNVEKHEEGISNSILEYMALGKPVIATDSGGTREIVVDGETGFIVGPGDSETISRKIIEILDNPLQGERMGMSGRSRAEQLFSLGTMGKNFINLYENVVNKKIRP